MAGKDKNKTVPVPTPFQQSKLIPKLDRLIQKLEQINVNTITNRGDARITIADTEIDGLLQELFGNESPRYQGYSYITPLDTAPMYTTHDTPIEQVRQAISERLSNAITVLKSIRDDIQSEAPTSGNAPDIRQVYQGLKLHQKIAKASNSLFQNGHYAEAVEASVKALTLYVKEKSGQSHLDGSTLMQHVFSTNKPILKINEMVTQSEKDEQQGFMHLFTGAALGIRNPHAHGFIIDTPERALEFIDFISLLAQHVDIAKN